MLATLELVAWYNKERLHSACGYVPLEEFKENHYARKGNLVSYCNHVGKKVPLKLPGRSISAARVRHIATTDIRPPEATPAMTRIEGTRV
jgi:hypothetical protein